MSQMESLKLSTLEESEQQCGGGKGCLGPGHTSVQRAWLVGRAFQLLSDQHMHKTAAVSLKVQTTNLLNKKGQYV